MGLHATSIHRQRLTHGPGEQAARSWDLVLWADLSFRLDTAPVREGDAQPAAMPSAFAADSCSVPAACQWERDAIDTALAALPPQGQGDTP